MNKHSFIFAVVVVVVIPFYYWPRTYRIGKGTEKFHNKKQPQQQQQKKKSAVLQFICYDFIVRQYRWNAGAAQHFIMQTTEQAKINCIS